MAKNPRGGGGHQNKNKNKGGGGGKAPAADPNFGYDNPYINTDLGADFANQNPESYFNLMAANAGVDVGGVSPFHQWLKNEGYGLMKTGYDNAKQVDSTINFRDWSNNQGAGFLSGLSGGAPSQGGGPVNTGNPFTSSTGSGLFGGAQSPLVGSASVAGHGNSLVHENNPFSVTPTGPQHFLGHGPGGGRDKKRNKNQIPGLPPPPLAAPPPLNTAGNPNIGGVGDIDALRRIFRNYTPEQRGEYSSGYSYGPARWSTF